MLIGSRQRLPDLPQTDLEIDDHDICSVTKQKCYLHAVSCLSGGGCSAVNNMLDCQSRGGGFEYPLVACPQGIEESAYKGLVRPILEYCSSVWDPQNILLQDEVENVKERAARFVTGNFNCETASMTGILEQLVGISEKEKVGWLVLGLTAL